MGITDRLDRELREHGRVVIETRRWKTALLALLGVLLTVTALLLMVVPDVGAGTRLLAAAVGSVLAFLTAVCGWRTVTGRPQLVVDVEGISVGGRRAAWSEIDGFSVIYVRGAPVGVVRGRDGHAPLAARNGVLRWMARHSGSTLPGALEVRPTVLVDWLSRQLRHRG